MGLTVTPLQCTCQLRLMIDQGNLMKPKPIKSENQKKRDHDRTGQPRSSHRSWFLVYQRVLPQACPLQHPWHLRGRKLIIPRLLQPRLPHHPWHLQLCQAKVWLDKNGETRAGQITIQHSCQVKVWIDKYEETRILLKHQKSCWINQTKNPKPI